MKGQTYVGPFLLMACARTPGRHLTCVLRDDHGQSCSPKGQWEIQSMTLHRVRHIFWPAIDAQIK